MIDFKLLKGTSLIEHVEKIIAKDNSETLSYYIETYIGNINLDSFIEISPNVYTRIGNDINITSIGHSEIDKEFIQDIFYKLDSIIDLDFIEFQSNDGSEIDIYSINYSSSFASNVIGQAISKSNSAGHWWEILWKDSDGKPTTNDLNKYTITHEIGHTLGLSHPNNEPYSSKWNTDDTVMSYNVGSNGYRDWFTDADIKALISIWGREDDNGYITYDKNFDEYDFHRINKDNYSIKTEIGLEDITHINSLKFKDKQINMIKDIKGTFDQLTGIYDESGEIFRIYNAAFSRFPDPEGLKYWIEKYTQKIDDYKVITKSFILSEEFINKYGNNISNNLFVEKIYTNVLGRDYDIEGFNYWTGNLENNIEERWSVLWNISQSDENITLFSEATGILI